MDELKPFPETWDEAHKWENDANEGKEYGEPEWKFDCNFKLDFDGSIIRISSRFYPPNRHYGPGWDGDISVMVGNTTIETINIECDTIEELKERAENEAVKIRERYTRQPDTEIEIENAFATLALYGVPRDRAVTVANGIMVLAERHRKAQPPKPVDSGCNGWISVEDRLPEEFRQVLIYPALCKAEFQYPKGRPLFFSGNESVFYLGVTHWMPLPQPPEQEEENG